MLQNVKNNKIYSDNFKIHVVELNQINLATEEDTAYKPQPVVLINGQPSSNPIHGRS
jgi:hypothetical protein